MTYYFEEKNLSLKAKGLLTVINEAPLNKTNTFNKMLKYANNDREELQAAIDELLNNPDYNTLIKEQFNLKTMAV